MKNLLVLIALLSSVFVFAQRPSIEKFGITFQDNGRPTTYLADGHFRYDSTAKKFEFYNGTAWVDFSSATETNDLSSVVTWANVPDANITSSSVTQWEANLTITESQISDLSHTTDTTLTLIDDDTMATATASNVPSGESIKAYVDGVVPTISNSVLVTLVTTAETVTETNVEDGVLFHQTSGANTVTVDPMALTYSGDSWFLMFKNTSGSDMTIANGAGVTGASHVISSNDFLTLFSEADDVWQKYNGSVAGGSESTTVSDTAEIDLTLSGSDISGIIVASSIDETKLDASVNASLDLADSASQGAHTTDTNLTDEEVQDKTGAMVTGNTETLITVTYQDADGTIDYVVDNDLANYSNTTSNFSVGAHTTNTDAQDLTLTGNTLAISGDPNTDVDISTATAVSANTSKVTNATHTGDVTGSGALTIGADKVLESHLKAVNVPTDEYILTYEATTGDFEWQAAAGGGDMSTSTYDGAGIAEQLVGLTATQTLTNKTLTTPVISGNLTTDGLIDGVDIATDVAANTAKITNATHTGDVTGDTALTIAVDAVDIAMLSATGIADGTTFLRGDNVWGGTTFSDGIDTPANYVGSAGYLLRVNATPSGVEFVDGTTLFAASSHAHIEADISDLTHTTDTNLDIASSAEVNTGTDNTKAISPLALAGSQLQTDVTANNAKVTNAFTAGDETKLDGIATGATVNDTDANLKARANHTGTQTAATISDFDTEVSNNASVTANTAKVSYTDAAKVAGIEALADVTDTANVTSAGALMDSEVDADIQTMTIAASSTISGSNTGDELAASTTVTGVIEVATGAETNTGTDATKAVSPDGLDDWTGSAQLVDSGITYREAVAISDNTTALTTGTKMTWYSPPYAITITDAEASLLTAATGAEFIVDVHDDGVTIMGTNKLDIEVSEFHTKDAVTQPAISAGSIAASSKLEAIIDQVGSTVAGAGAIIYIYYTID